MADPVTNGYWIVPYRDTATAENTILNAQAAVAKEFITRNLGNPRVREGYWYDLQEAGGSAYSGSNELTFASGSNKYGFPYQVQLSLTVPQSKAWVFYGIADYSASPALQAFQLSQNDVNFPVVYLSPHLYTAPDHRAILNGNFAAIAENDSITLNLYGTAAQTDKIDILFELAEKAAKTA